jgi:uncharacterized protein YyaL (SSP411 family)
MPNNYQFLLKSYALSKNQKIVDGVNISLQNIANGGIYDHLGGGFARYATDADWTVPHFEKMLYDNAQLVSVYSEAYRLTQNELYKQRVYETLDFIKREMTSPEGGFYSSLDADTEGEEGKFYTWTTAEVDSFLQNPVTAALFKKYFNMTEEGNWEKGKNVLHITVADSVFAAANGLQTEEFNNLMADAKQLLFEERQNRARPGLDDKILTSWNALMLKGYIDAYRSFGDPAFLEVALKNADFLAKKVMKKDNRMNRNYKDGKSVINGFLDDYAFTAEAFIALYQATFDEKWVFKAKALSNYAIEHFYDQNTSSFFYTSDLDPPLITRKKEMVDDVMPSSNSTMAKVLYYLSLYFYEPEQEEIAKNMVANMLPAMKSAAQPHFYSNWATTLIDLVYEPFEVAIIGDDFNEVRSQLDQHFIPNMLLLGGKKEGKLELLEGKFLVGETTIYVCKNKVCKFPVNTVEEALELMKEL